MSESKTIEAHDLINVSELAKLCGVTRQALFYWRKAGKLGDGVRVGKVVLYRRADVAFLFEAK